VKKSLLISLALIVGVIFAFSMQASAVGDGLCEGCTPGYWKNHLESWVDYGPANDFDTAFGVDLFEQDINLLQALHARGGGTNQLARHAAAALLNATNLEVDDAFDVEEVISLVQTVGDGRDAEEVAEILVEANEMGCPLD